VLIVGIVEHHGLGEETTPEILPTREPFRSVLRWLGLVEQAAGIVLLIVIVALVLVPVVQRWRRGGGWAWTGEIARFSMVWATFVLAGYLQAHDQHIAIKVVDYFLPIRVLGAVKLFGHALIAVTCIALVYATYDFMTHDRGQVTAAAQIPLTIIYAVVAASRRPPCGPSSSSAGSPGDQDRRKGRVSLALLGPSSCCSSCASRWRSPSWAPACTSPSSLGLAVRLVVEGINSWPLLAVPLFILVGIVATRTEIAARLYDAALLLLGPLRAGLAYVNIGVSLGFSWMSGAALADAAGIGSIEVDHMRKKGYPAEFSVGLSASSALISPIMPPSIPAVVFASVAAVSTGALFAAAVVPALLVTLSLVVTVWIWARRRPDLVGEPYDWGKTARALVRALPPMGAPVLILGGILGGWFTPTEAAAIGALYMLVLALMYRTVKLRELTLIFRDTASITAQIMLIIGASALLSWILAREQVPQAVATALLGFTDNPMIFLLVINVVLILLGMILEPTSALLIVTPILLPVAVAFGIDPLQFGSIVIFGAARRLPSALLIVLLLHLVRSR
jgi:tripartite ATP-independent transporter DctM subunit